MKLYYFKDPHGNFGDDINQWLWEKVLPGRWREDDVSVSGIGTLLNHVMPPSKKWVVFGSGAGYGARPIGWGGDGWKVLCVRGPLTAKVLGLLPDAAVTDGALLLALLPECQPVAEEERSGVVFMPHHHAMVTGAWREVCQLAGVEYIDPRDDSVSTVQKIRHAKLVIADAMHAAIVADYLRVPWVPVSISRGTNCFKWLDWCLSMDVPFNPVILPRSTVHDVLRDATLGFYGEASRCWPPDVQNALADYESKRRLVKKGYLSPYLRVMRKAMKLGCGALAKLEAMLPGAIGRRERRLQRAAQALKQLCQQTGYLSRDAIFQKRLEEMRMRLDDLALEADAR